MTASSVTFSKLINKSPGGCFASILLRELPFLLNRQLDSCSHKLSLRRDKDPFLGAFLINKEYFQSCGLAAWFLDATVKKLTK